MSQFKPVDQNNFLYEAFLQSPALVAIAKGPNHVYELVNDQYRKTIGSGHKLEGKTAREALPELVSQGIIELMNAAYESGQTQHGYEIPLRINKQKLQSAYYNFVLQPLKAKSGKVEGVLIHATDVTAQALARHEAEQLTAELEALIESLPDGLIIADESGIKQVNQGAAELFGYGSPADVPTDMAQIYKELKAKNAEGKPVQSDQNSLNQAMKGKRVMFERVFTHPQTGDEIIVRAAAAPIRNEHGDIIGAVAINSDITESRRLSQQVQKSAEQQTLLNQRNSLLKQQNAELIALNTAKDEFIGLASHQLRTPATGVKQYIGMMLEDYVGPLTEEQRTILTNAYNSNERQLHIVNNLLRVVQIELDKTTLHKKVSDIGTILEDMISEQSDSFVRRNQNVVLNRPSKQLLANVDHEYLRMALDNILDNASKYTPPGKEIIVSAETTSETLKVRIQDAGVGIAAEDLPRLFQKFSRIDNPLSVQAGGTGLGLYWTKKVIDLHGGTITVDSTPGKGTTFTLELPINTKD